MKLQCIVMPFAIAALVCGANGLAQETKTEMITVKYDRLKEEVLKHRGKVLIVDFWAGW